MLAGFNRVTSTRGDPHVFSDTQRKLTFGLTYIKRLTAFACVFIDKVRPIQSGLFIPLNFIERVVGSMLSKLYKPFDYQVILNYNVPRAKVYFSNFYLGDISKQIASDVKKIGFKDKQPRLNRSNLIV